MRDIIGADQAAAAAAIVDHDGAELRLDPLRPHPPDHVVHAGRHRGDHQADGAGRVAVLVTILGERGRREQYREQADDPRSRPFHRLTLF